MELVYDLAIPLLDIYPKNKKRPIQKDTMFIAALFTIAKSQKQPKCPLTDKCTKKMLYVYVYTHTHTHIYNGILLGPKEE